MLATVTVSVARAAPSDEAARLVFLLQYIGTDYPGAVEDGAVVNEFEYREMMDFAAAASEKLERLRPDLPPAVADRAVETVRVLARDVRERADPERVRASTEAIIPALVDAFDLKPVPRAVPDPARARALYRENCALCHGERGGGDGPRAAQLEPPPVAFTDRERMDRVAPYVFYNAITFGIDGTSMASFAEAFGDQERWDLAFFLWSFVAPDHDPRAAVGEMPLRDLATLSAEELAARIVNRPASDRAADGREEAILLVASLRARPRPVTDHAERLARVRRQLHQGIALMDGGELEEAAEVVTTAYLTDFEPLEPTLDRLDTSVRQRFEAGLVELRQALRRGDGRGAREVADRLLGTVRSAEDLFQERRPLSTTVFLVGFAVILVGGLALMIRRRA